MYQARCVAGGWLEGAIAFGLLVGLAGAAEVNPLTGTPLALEQKQRRLEELRLETQMLEEEVKQAELRGRVGVAGLARPGRSPRALANSPTVPPWPAPTHAEASPRPKGAKTLARRPPEGQPSQGAHSMAAAAGLPRTATPVLRAIFSARGGRRAVFALDENIVAGGEGEMLAGLHLTEVEERSARLGGVRYVLPTGWGTLVGAERAGQEVAVDGARIRPLEQGAEAGGSADAFAGLPPLPPLAPFPGPTPARNGGVH